MSKINHSSKFKKKLSDYLNSDEFLFNDCFRLSNVRDMLTKDRFFNIFEGKIDFGHSNQISSQTIEHNSNLSRMFYKEMSQRPDLISRPLSSLNSVAMNAYKMKVLTIGSRTEAEIFSLVDAGFNISNIKAVDLFTYSPLIEIGDVTQLQYEDNEFDIVICGWVLEFVTNIEKAASEILRVTKPNGYIAIGGMHHPISLDLEAYNKRGKHDDRIWYASIENIMNLFTVSYQDVIFKSDIEHFDHDKRGEVILIFKSNSEKC